MGTLNKKYKVKEENILKLKQYILKLKNEKTTDLKKQ